MTVPLSAALGWAVGMRSVTPPAALSRALAQNAHPHPNRQPAHALASGAASGLLPVAALGEMVMDKLPSTPDRTSAPVLAGRIASGALVGVVLGQVRRTSPVAAALAGAAGAAVSSFAMMRLRGWAGARLGVPDAAVAVAEDALAVGLSTAVVRRALQ